MLGRGTEAEALLKPQKAALQRAVIDREMQRLGEAERVAHGGDAGLLPAGAQAHQPRPRRSGPRSRPWIKSILRCAKSPRPPRARKRPRLQNRAADGEERASAFGLRPISFRLKECEDPPQQYQAEAR